MVLSSGVIVIYEINENFDGNSLTPKDLFISESCIEIKIQLNFFTLSGIGTLRVKREKQSLRFQLNEKKGAMKMVKFFLTI